MRYLKEIKDDVYEKKLIALYRGIPVRLYMCNLKNVYSKSKYFMEQKWDSPCFVHPCTNFFDTVKEYSIIIAYDENFKKMSEKAQNILIYHELGHVLQKDPSKRKLSDELAADKFAMDKIGKISKKQARLMAEWICHYGKRGYESSYKEFIARFT